MKQGLSNVTQSDLSDWRQSCYWDIGSLLLLFAVFLFGLKILPALGVSWDEHYHLQWGAEKWDNYANWLSGSIRFDEFLQLKQSSVHPGFFDLMLQGLLRLEWWSPNQTLHVLSACFGFLGLVACCLTGRSLLGRMGGFIALCLLIATPRYFGHMWFNPKDIPFAACYLWSLYFLVRAIGQWPKPSGWLCLAIGSCTGLALGVRIAGLLIPFYFGVYALIYFVLESYQKRFVAKQLLRVALWGSLCGLIAYLTVLPFWPALWVSLHDAEAGLAGAVSKAQSFNWDGPVLFSGAFIRSTALPWNYLPKWILITLPEWTILLILCGILLGLGWLFTGKVRSIRRFGQWTVIGLSAFFPIAYVVATGPTLYDGMRHFLFVLPPLILIATGAVDYAGRLLQGVSIQWLFRVPALVTIACCLIVLHQYARLYPYMYVYFNGWVGGLSGAYNNYETDYWGLSYREAILSLESELKQESGEIEEMDFEITISGTSHLVGPFLPSNFHLTKVIESADFYIAYTRANQHMKGSGEVFTIVSREGVPLNVVWDQRKVSSE